MLGFIFILLLGSAAGNTHCNHGHPGLCTTPNTLVDQALVDLNLHYNNNLCLEILLIDCSTHVTAGDEVVCGSNFVTYENHCHFAHARCEHHLVEGQGAPELQALHAGSCSGTTGQQVVTTNAAVTTGTAQPIVSTANMASTSMPQNTDMTTTTNPPPTTTMSQTTTTTALPTTTAINVGPIFHDLFCKNIDNISCNSGFSIVCASDGQFYPNNCELSKAKCKDASLTVDSDTSNCTLP